MDFKCQDYIVIELKTEERIHIISMHFTYTWIGKGEQIASLLLKFHIRDVGLQ
jgi:hypothetical protein